MRSERTRWGVRGGVVVRQFLSPVPARDIRAHPRLVVLAREDIAASLLATAPSATSCVVQLFMRHHWKFPVGRASVRRGRALGCSSWLLAARSV